MEKVESEHPCFFCVPKNLVEDDFKKVIKSTLPGIASAFRESAEQDRCVLFARC